MACLGTADRDLVPLLSHSSCEPSFTTGKSVLTLELLKTSFPSLKSFNLVVEGAHGTFKWRFDFWLGVKKILLVNFTQNTW
jgi:hypothetical protein